MSENYPVANPALNNSHEFYFIADRTSSYFIDEIDLATKTLQNEKGAGKFSNGRIYENLIRLKIPDELIIIGDLHGDLPTLIRILQKVSFRKFLSNPNNKMIFLGDYIDRGSDSAGILHVVCYLKRKYPDSVVLLCGNHEAVELFHFSAHTLPQELDSKYGAKSRLVYEKLLFLFRLLPKAVIIEGHIIITHGGLPAGIDENHFIDRLTQGDKQVIEELLWNDPRSDMPTGQDWCPSRRSFGKHFGDSITKRYLVATKTKALVRGHEPCPGFMVTHGGMVLTLFSSKEAYQKFDAAYLHISKESLQSIQNAADLVHYVKKIKEES